jgi:hypothetical protein
MECAKQGAANGHSPWQAERQSRPPGKAPRTRTRASVEREGAQAAARDIVKQGAHAAAPAPQASLTVSRQPSLRVAANCGVCIVALLGFVVQATTFVVRLATIRILPATRFTKDLIRGSLSVSCPGELLAAAVASPHRNERVIEQEGIKDQDKRIW